MQPEKAPSPEVPDVAETLAGLLAKADGYLDICAGVMAAIEAGRVDPELVHRVPHLTATGRELRTKLDHASLLLALREEEVAWIRADERQRIRGAVPRQRKSRQQEGRHARSGAVLKLAPAIAVGGALLRRSLTRRPVLAALRTSLTAHKVAMAASSAVAAGGTAAVLTVTALGPHVTLPYTGPSSAAPAPAASIFGAVPIPLPSSSLIAQDVTHPETITARKDLGSRTPVSPSSLPTLPSPAGSSPAAPSASSAPAGPAVLTVSTSGLDLSAVSQAAVILTASGSGWVSWSVATTGTDLVFSATHGVLQAGQSATITVSLASSQDGLAAQVFTIGGQQVTVALPLPVVIPAPSASAVLPSLLPSPGSS
jgi:hypothetical protein